VREIVYFLSENSEKRVNLEKFSALKSLKTKDLSYLEIAKKIEELV
jgi:hypothetical protein